MDGQGRMGLHHWANFESSCLKDRLKDHPAVKLMDMVVERDAAVAEQYTATAEKKTAFAERDAALLQRDVAYANRNAAWMERDAALAALAILRAEKNNNEAATKLIQLVNMAAVPLSTMEVNSMAELPEKQGKQGGRKAKKRNKLAEVASHNMRDDLTGLKPPVQGNSKEKASHDERGKVDRSPNNSHGAIVSYFPLEIPVPHCSCTGTAQQCYRWGKGGWQSACCTHILSMYPLPMSPSKSNARVPGRKMSGGAFKKLLERLLADGLDVASSVDLKNYWSKHGTNRYVTIK